MEWSAEKPTTEPIEPQPKLEFVSYDQSVGNIETVVCRRAISNNWVSNYLQEEQYADLRIQTQLGHYLDLLHRKYMYDDFLEDQI